MAVLYQLTYYRTFTHHRYYYCQKRELNKSAPYRTILHVLAFFEADTYL